MPAEDLVKLIAIELGLRPTATADEILGELKRLRAAAAPRDDDEEQAEDMPPPHHAPPVVAPAHVSALLTVGECAALHEAIKLLGELMPAEMLATLSGLASRLPGAAEREAA